MNKLKNFGAVSDELKIENGKLKINGGEASSVRRPEGGTPAGTLPIEELKINGDGVILSEAKNLLSASQSLRFFGSNGHLPQNDGHWLAKRISASAPCSEAAQHDKAGKPLERKNCFSNFGVECEASAGRNPRLRPAFTLAEVLITLVVIGVVAAVTIPVLMSNTNGKEWNAAKQKARASLGEAFKLMSINNELETYDNGGEGVVDNILQKYIKISKVCKGETAPTDCGFPKTFKTPEGGTVQSSDLKNWSSWLGYTWISGDGIRQGVWLSGDVKKAGFFQTLDGFSVALFYNPNCRADEIDNAWNKSSMENEIKNYGITKDGSFSAACFNAVYDMNGNKGPNTVGKDIGFVGSFYTGVSARAAAVLPVSGSEYALNESAKKADFNQASDYCKKLGLDYDLPTIDELSLIYLNKKATGDIGFSTSGQGYFWSRSPVPGSSDIIRDLAFDCGGRDWYVRTAPHHRVRCVRADKLM